VATIRTAEILSIGSELTTGETRDTNAGDLARDLSGRGVVIQRIQALPDRLEVVQRALGAALAASDLVVTTGGLGPTPDDLTREAIAATLGEDPAVDATLAAHLRSLFARRGLEMPELNVKQAWLIPSAEPLANPFGSAPGWWIERDGRVLVALPGPPGEMTPMWRDLVLPRLDARGLGDGRVVRVLRASGLGESLIVEMLGEGLFRDANPEVATYARADAVDIRITATDADGGSAAELADRVERRIAETLGAHVFARGAEDWPAALGAALDGRRLATVEAGSGGQLAALLAEAPWFAHGEVLASARLAELPERARRARLDQGAEVGLALRAATRRGDTLASVVVDAGALGAWRDRRVVFLAGAHGRHRAALAACLVLYRGLVDRRAAERGASGPAT
jgi:nicotinamide-nucleotide amidase